MHPDALSFSLSQVVTILVAMVGGLSVLGAILFAGIWDKFFKAKVRSEVRSFNDEPTNVEAFEKAVTKVIDNQISRRDGIIHKEIVKQVEDGNARVLLEIQTLRRDLGDVGEISNRLGHIEGSVNVILQALRVSTPTPHTGT